MGAIDALIGTTRNAIEPTSAGEPALGSGLD